MGMAEMKPMRYMHKRCVPLSLPNEIRAKKVTRLDQTSYPALIQSQLDQRCQNQLYDPVFINPLVDDCSQSIYSTSSRNRNEGRDDFWADARET